MADTISPKIPMADIKDFLKKSKDANARQIVSQLLQERNEFADKLLDSCVVPIGSKITTESAHSIIFRDSEEYDAVVSIGQHTEKPEEMENHYWLDGQYDGYDKPGKDREKPEEAAAEKAPYQAPAEKGDGEPA